jgi:hypothetical protein
LWVLSTVFAGSNAVTFSGYNFVFNIFIAVKNTTHYSVFTWSYSLSISAVCCLCMSHTLLFVMKTFTQQYLVSQKEYLSVLPKTELSIRHLVVAICTNCCNIKKSFCYMVSLFIMSSTKNNN